MKKYLLILLAIRMLAVSSPSDKGLQLFMEIGTFFHHFFHHLNQQENIGILDFVQMHYFGHEHQEADHDGHKNLPFQHQHDQQNPAPQSPFLLTYPHSIAAFSNLGIISKPLIYQSQRRHSTPYFGDIWQPPKVS